MDVSSGVKAGRDAGCGLKEEKGVIVPVTPTCAAIPQNG
jgi:hypothetical protein